MENIQRDEVIIEASDLMAKIDDPALRIFDATVLMNQSEGSPDARAVYLEQHIPGAAFFDHQACSDPNSKYQLTLADGEYLAQRLGDLGIANDSEVVVYSTGILAWATRVWWLLRYLGHTNVRVLNGGLDAWVQAGGATASGEEAYAGSQFSVSLQSGYFASKQEVEHAISTGESQAVNSLPQAVYDQAHIPNSVCQPCTDFLEGGTTLLPDAELKQKLIASATGHTITYCGGGVAATVNAIVCRLVGNPDVSVYDGSMSEWVGEGMPVASSSS